MGHGVSFHRTQSMHFPSDVRTNEKMAAPTEAPRGPQPQDRATQAHLNTPGTGSLRARLFKQLRNPSPSPEAPSSAPSYGFGRILGNMLGIQTYKDLWSHHGDRHKVNAQMGNVWTQGMQAFLSNGGASNHPWGNFGPQPYSHQAMQHPPMQSSPAMASHPAPPGKAPVDDAPPSYEDSEKLEQQKQAAANPHMPTGLMDIGLLFGSPLQSLLGFRKLEAEMNKALTQVAHQFLDSQNQKFNFGLRMPSFYNSSGPYSSPFPTSTAFIPSWQSGSGKHF